MNKLLISKNLGFKISWGYIFVGLFGVDEIPSMLSRSEVVDYFKQDVNDNNNLNEIVELLCLENESLKFDEFIKSSAKNQGILWALEKQKWIVLKLKLLLDSFSEDYFQGILELMEFWNFTSDSTDCPIIFPKSHSDIQEYFTLENYKKLVAESQTWFNEKVKLINSVENNMDNHGKKITTG